MPNNITIPPSSKKRRISTKLHKQISFTNVRAHIQCTYTNRLPFPLNSQIVNLSQATVIYLIGEIRVIFVHPLDHQQPLLPSLCLVCIYKFQRHSLTAPAAPTDCVDLSLRGSTVPAERFIYIEVYTLLRIYLKLLLHHFSCSRKPVGS